MWIVDGLFALVAVILASSLWWAPAPALIVLPLIGWGLLLIDHVYGRHLPRFLVPALLLPWLVALVLVTAVIDGRAPFLVYPLVVGMASAMLVVMVVTPGRHHSALFYGAPLMAGLLWFVISAGNPLAAYGASILVLWLLACSPLLLLLPNDRWTLGAVMLSPFAALGMAAYVAADAGASRAIAEPVVAAIPLALLNPLVLVQAILLLLVAIPLSLEAEFRWRFAALGSTGALVVSAVMAWIFMGAPQYWSVEVTLLLTLAALIMMVAFAGILASVRRPHLRLHLAMRIMTLANLATAVQFTWLLGPAGSAERFIDALAQALAPMVAGTVMTLVVGASALIPQAGATHLRTERLRRLWRQSRRRLVLTIATLGQDLGRGMVHDLRHLSDPWRLLPLMIFAAAWPALFALEAGLWLLLWYLVAFMTASVAQRHLALWLAIHLSIIASVALSLGYEWPLLPLFAGVALLAAWPFCRWPQFDPAFAYPTSMVLLCPLWLSDPRVEPSQLMMGMTGVVLLANGLRRGPVRWILLAAGVVVMLWWSIPWILESDPYITIILSEINVAQEVAALASIVPLMVLILLLLWVSRERGASWWLGLTGLPLATAAAGLLLTLIWAAGVREQWWQGLVAAAILLLLRRQLSEPLSLMQGRDFRHPATTALAIVLMLLMVAVSTALGHLPSTAGVSVSEQRVRQPGVLGPVYLQLLRQIGGLALAFLLVVGWQLCASHGRQMLALATSTAIRGARSPGRALAPVAGLWRPQAYLKHAVAAGEGILRLLRYRPWKQE